MDAAALLDALRTDTGLGPQLVETLYLPRHEARFGEPDPPLAPPIAAALARRGVERLWSHQVEGLEALRRGEDVLITTPTASGKSLVFQLPVLEAAARGEPGRALFLYPLKALGQDQKQKLDRLAADAGLQVGCEVYDGDTEGSRRAEIKREPPRVLITNPDMLHLGILSYWRSWTPFLRDLRWIVIDELHTYRGIFGSHFHHVLQRLLRLCREEGARPRIVASSATAENADEFAERLTGRSFHWIRESGAPRQGRHLALWRPVASPYTLSLELFERFVRDGLKTIAFTKARRITELLYSWLKRRAPDLAPRVASYRSGFLAGERRKIEGRLFEGKLDGVISTSALEMGIDVGGLDACILVGYPGSVMATWQRSGRVGRESRESITALVALPDALDQYLLDHPSELVERPCEPLVVDPANEPISRAHLVCSAAELPFERERDRELLEPHAAVVGELLRDGELVEAVDSGEICSARLRPQRRVHLRGTSATAAILDAATERLVGTVDGVRVLHECHPGAVYLHGGRQFLVRDLDLDGAKVLAEPVRVDYFTTPLTEKDTRVLEVVERRSDGPLQSFLGRLRVTERVVGYERKQIQSQEPLSRHELELPAVRFETVGLWWAAPPELEAVLRAEERHFMGSLHAAEHAAIALLPLHALCDRNDLGGISLALHPQLATGAVFIYDGHPGGVGIARKGFDELPRLLGRVIDLLEGCACEAGCPSCVQSPKCGNGNRPLDKPGAARLLRLLVGRDRLPDGVATRVDVRLEPGEDDDLRDPGEPPPRGGGERVEGEEEAVSAVTRTVEVPAALEHRAEPAPAPVARTAPPREREEAAPAAPKVRPRRSAAFEILEPAAPRPRRARRRPRVAGPPLPAHPETTVLFDLETIRSAAEVGGWNRAYRMRVAVGVALVLEEGRFEVFREERIAELVELLESADVVVGFNIRRFDYQVLSGYTGIDYRRRLPTRDLLVDVHQTLGRRLSLNSLAKATLGVEKTADGLQSLEWVRRGELDKVEAYCRKDVEILRDLYLYGRRMGHVLYADKEGRRFKLEVDW